MSRESETWIPDFGGEAANTGLGDEIASIRLLEAIRYPLLWTSVDQ